MNLTSVISFFVLVLAANCHSAIAKDGQARLLKGKTPKAPKSPKDVLSLLPSRTPSFFSSNVTESLTIRAPTAAPTIAPPRPLWVIPDDSAFSRLSTDDGTDVEDIPTLGDDDKAIVNIGFTYNWFGNDLTQLVIQSNGQLFMDTSNNSTSAAVVSIGDYSGSRIAFANGDLDPPAGAGCWCSKVWS
eukprot:scaffold984_cov281-Chaetoceros_neogracile.AAC.23